MTATAKQALYTKINQQNSVSYSDANVVLSAPMEQVDPNVSPRNTKVIVTGKPEAGKIGSVTMYYNRESLRALTGQEPVDLVWGNENMISDLIPKINEALNINIVAEDLVDAELPDRSEAFASFSISADAGSYGWTDFFVVNLNVSPGNVEDEIVDQEL